MTKEEYAALLRDPKWQARRKQILKRAHSRCEQCGKDGPKLDVHHRRYRKGHMPWEYPDMDLVALCSDCHAAAHGKAPPVPAAQRASNMLLDFVQIETPAEFRALLMSTAVAVLDGRVNVAQANAVVGLSAEVHKSLRQQWDMQCYVAENIAVNGGQVLRLGVTTVDAEAEEVSDAGT
jgi:hypothetical protein